MGLASFQSYAYQTAESNDSTFSKEPSDENSSHNPKLATKSIKSIYLPTHLVCCLLNIRLAIIHNLQLVAHQKLINIQNILEIILVLFHILIMWWDKCITQNFSCPFHFLWRLEHHLILLKPVIQ